MLYVLLCSSAYECLFSLYRLWRKPHSVGNLEVWRWEGMAVCVGTRAAASAGCCHNHGTGIPECACALRLIAALRQPASASGRNPRQLRNTPAGALLALHTARAAVTRAAAQSPTQSRRRRRPAIIAGTRQVRIVFGRA